MDALNAVLGLGFMGLIMFLIVWAIIAIITGYFMGIGIWMAMPAEFKKVIGYDR